MILFSKQLCFILILLFEIKYILGSDTDYWNDNFDQSKNCENEGRCLAFSSIFSPLNLIFSWTATELFLPPCPIIELIWNAFPYQKEIERLNNLNSTQCIMLHIEDGDEEKTFLKCKTHLSAMVQEKCVHSKVENRGLLLYCVDRAYLTCCFRTVDFVAHPKACHIYPPNILNVSIIFLPSRTTNPQLFSSCLATLLDGAVY